MDAVIRRGSAFGYDLTKTCPPMTSNMKIINIILKRSMIMNPNVTLQFCSISMKCMNNTVD